MSTLEQLQDNGIDWRQKGTVAPVTGMGMWCPSDIFTTVSMVESAHELASGKMETLATDQVLDCVMQGQSPCSGGYKVGSTLEYIQKYGLMKASDYHSTPGKCGYDASKVAVKIKSVEKVDPNSEDALEAALMKSPIMVGVEAENDTFMNYKSGVVTEGCGKGEPDDTKALAVGWKVENGQKYYIL
jgi:hypothetical protein